MTTGHANRVLTHLHRAVLLHERGVTDAQLLERFLARREEVAFEALLRRHGPMVLGVCRRILADAQDAEDAFQATFLVLVRRAASIVPRSRLGAWLYGVARRTALKARSSAARRRRAELEAGRTRPLTAPTTSAQIDLRWLLDEELGRLAEKYRSPLVLCLLEGKSRKEAAGLLGWSEGTLSGRLARAKVLLSRRLRRRGVTPAAAAPAALAEGVAAVKVPAPLAAATLQAAASLPGPAAARAISAPVLALTEEIVKAMLLSKLKVAANLVVLVVAVGCGLGAVAWQSGRTAPETAPAEAGTNTQLSALPGKDVAKASSGYVIEPPDILLVEYARLEAADPVKIVGQRLVRPDGTISLGSLGAVLVSGQTVEGARQAIAEHLAHHLGGFDPRKLNVQLSASNSKVIYIITGGEGAEQVYRLPAHDGDTVLDAIATARLSLVGIGRKSVYVARPSAGKDNPVLRVDCKAIIGEGDTRTNYRLKPGDRVYIQDSPRPSARGQIRTDLPALQSRDLRSP
jgi:RNA polymerase sigma factor (sigma-70 family)